MNELVFSCPHCEQPILIYENEINCMIFRHAVFKETMEQVDPHASKEMLDLLVMENKVYGCGKPFRLIRNEGSFLIVECGYV